MTWNSMSWDSMSWNNMSWNQVMSKWFVGVPLALFPAIANPHSPASIRTDKDQG